MIAEKSVTRQAKLTQFSAFLDRALQARGHIAFVVGEAGSGKTALITGFASRAENGDRDLVAAIGNCFARMGIGNLYLPFRKIPAQISGSVRSRPARNDLVLSGIVAMEALGEGVQFT